MVDGEGKRRVVEGVNSSKIYLIHCKNFCKGHNVSPLSTMIQKTNFFKKKSSWTECNHEQLMDRFDWKERILTSERNEGEIKT
jgi:hypothetical protein